MAATTTKPESVKVAVDIESLRDQLEGRGAPTRIDLVDGSGKLIAAFFRVGEYENELYREAVSRISPERLERARRQTGGRTLKEILDSPPPLPTQE